MNATIDEKTLGKICKRPIHLEKISRQGGKSGKIAWLSEILKKISKDQDIQLKGISLI